MRHRSLGFLLLSLFLSYAARGRAEPPKQLGIELTRQLHARPLEVATVVGAGAGTLVVSDGEGRPYAHLKAGPRARFQVGGSLGTHTVRWLRDGDKLADQTSFTVEAESQLVEDTGRFGELYQMALDTMTVRRAGPEDGAPEGGHHSTPWRGKRYQLYDLWVLDQAQTSKGMAYVSSTIRDGVSIFRDAQRADGMIWSFFEPDSGTRGYWDTAYGALGYVNHDSGLTFVRQPVDNHTEYEFVNMLFTAWQASGDDAFMKASLDAALRALNYALHDPVRYSTRFGLLKRPYTIDSWDFQIDDAYLVQGSLSPVMTIDPQKTKFGIFFGDNTGYIQASESLAIMLDHVGRAADATSVRERAQVLAGRLRALSWNGRFFRHFLEEDATVQRELGVDEASQLSQGNAYSLNRGIPHDQAAAILQTYGELQKHLPPGSPGEWYAIYPPFGRGAGDPQQTWQYMNGGVSGHAASELARGAYAHGFEAYGTSVLERSAALARKTDRKIHFAYTGSIPPPPSQPQAFSPIDLRPRANMDTVSPSKAHAWMDAEAGNDLASLPTGKLTVGDAPFTVIDPAQNQRRSVVALAERAGYARSVDVPLKSQRAGAVYLLHALQGGPSAEDPSDDVAASLTFHYADGTRHGVYLKRGQHVSGWWFPQLVGPTAGVAWRGPNAKTGDVGLSWCAITNPNPDKPLVKLSFAAAANGRAYALAGLTLADRAPYQPPSAISYGGPDNWSGANMVAALMQGVAGIRDTDRAYGTAEVSPRWTSTEAKRAHVVARYGASQGYVAYDFEHRPQARTLNLTLTGSGRAFRARVLLPAGVTAATVALDGRAVQTQIARVESSSYVEIDVPAGLHRLALRY